MGDTNHFAHRFDWTPHRRPSFGNRLVMPG
jgi:hypothetical protein